MVRPAPKTTTPPKRKNWRGTARCRCRCVGERDFGVVEIRFSTNEFVRSAVDFLPPIVESKKWFRLVRVEISLSISSHCRCSSLGSDCNEDQFEGQNAVASLLGQDSATRDNASIISLSLIFVFVLVFDVDRRRQSSFHFAEQRADGKVKKSFGSTDKFMSIVHWFSLQPVRCVVSLDLRRLLTSFLLSFSRLVSPFNVSRRRKSTTKTKKRRRRRIRHRSARKRCVN